MYAPRIVTLQVKPDKVRDIIGPGGKTIRGDHGADRRAIEIDDNGIVPIASPDGIAVKQAIDIIKGLTIEPEVGQFYNGIVKTIVEFGAFVEILPGTDGLVHISELDEKRVRAVEDVCKEGDEMLVKVHRHRSRRQDSAVAPRGDGQVARRRPQLPRRRLVIPEDFLESSATSRVRVRFRRVRPNAATPRYMSEHAAGVDLASAADAPVVVAPNGGRAAVPTGLALEIPIGFEGQVRPRSGLARKAGVTVLNAPGTIDADYRGEVVVLLVNLGHEPYTINSGDRIAQLVIAPVTRGDFEEATELSTTDRGDGGFGHTG